MPKIASHLNELYEYIKILEKNAGIKKMPVVLLNFKTTPQRGQTCKLIAGYNVEYYLFSNKQHSTAPLPVTKDKGKHPSSLRERAKKITGSQVGEVYGPEQIGQVLAHNQFAVNSYRLPDHDVCMQFIKDMLQHETPVITYFDVTIPTSTVGIPGTPTTQQGYFEHAAAIIGYYFDSEDNMQLLVAEWGNKNGSYFEFSFDDLFASTSQLSAVKTQERYKKYNPVLGFFDHPMWLEVNQLNHTLALNAQATEGFTSLLWQGLQKIALPIWPSNGERLTTPPQGEASSLRAIFTVITGNQQNTRHLDNYKDYLVSNHKDDQQDMSVTSSTAHTPTMTSSS